MCYRISQQQTRLDGIDEAGPQPRPHLRPRWVGAALLLAAGAASAAFLVVPAVRDAFADPQPAIAQPVAATVAQPVALERVSTTSLPADDDVPSVAKNVSMAAGHDCHGSF